MKHNKSPHIKARQSNQIGRKEYQEQANESKIQPFTLLGDSQNYQNNRYNIQQGHSVDLCKLSACYFRICEPI